MDGLGRALLEKTSDAVLVAHVETGRVIGWNPAAERLFGYTAEEAQGMHVDLLVPEPIRPYHAAGFKRFQETNEAATLSAKHPSKLTILTKDGESVKVYGSLARVDGGTSRLLMATFRRRSHRVPGISG